MSPVALPALEAAVSLKARNRHVPLGLRNSVEQSCPTTCLVSETPDCGMALHSLCTRHAANCA
jgi:hypothetical protein